MKENKLTTHQIFLRISIVLLTTLWSIIFISSCNNSKNEIEIIGIRAGEKIHETLATRLELSMSEDLGGHYRIENQSDFNQEYTNQSENYQGVVNSKFSNFSTADYSFSSYPPLTSEFGSIDVKVPHETLVFKSINGTLTQEPLWFTFDYNSGRSAILLAENLWKWRMHSFREDQNFETLIYLGSNPISFMS